MLTVIDCHYLPFTVSYCHSDLIMNTIGMLTPMLSSWNGEWYGGELVCAYDGFLHFVVGNGHEISPSVLSRFFIQFLELSKNRNLPNTNV